MSGSDCVAEAAEAGEAGEGVIACVSGVDGGDRVAAVDGVSVGATLRCIAGVGGVVVAGVGGVLPVSGVIGLVGTDKLAEDAAGGAAADKTDVLVEDDRAKEEICEGEHIDISAEPPQIPMHSSSSRSRSCSRRSRSCCSVQVVE